MLLPNRNPNDHNDCDLLARLFLHSFKYFDSIIDISNKNRKKIPQHRHEAIFRL